MVSVLPSEYRYNLPLLTVAVTPKIESPLIALAVPLRRSANVAPAGTVTSVPLILNVWPAVNDVTVEPTTDGIPAHHSELPTSTHSPALIPAAEFPADL